MFIPAFMLVFPASAQTLVSIEELEVASLNFVEAGYQASPNIPFELVPTNGYDAYLVIYTMDNIEGEQVNVSGLFLRPQAVDAQGEKYPLVVSMHGTTASKYDVPSTKTPIADFFRTSPDEIGFDLSHIFCTQGYVTIAPDFLGMGESTEAFHPYVHARSEAESGLAMMMALRGTPEFDEIVNEELFLTGYSQGGHASMALHELLVEEYPEIEITAASHMSGPYSISDVMRNDVILKDSTYGKLGFLPYTILSYQFAYPELEQDVGAIFRSSYVPLIEAFRDGYSGESTDLNVFNEELKRLYTLAETDESYYPSRLLNPKFAEELAGDPDNPWLEVLRDNDTYDFVNPTPTRLIYCKADEQVSFRNARVAEDTLRQLGGEQTLAIDVDPDADHTGCLLPAITTTLDFFAEVPLVGTQEIPGAGKWRWLRTERTLRVVATDATTTDYTLTLSDVLGRTSQRQSYRSGELIDLSGLTSGTVAVRLTDEFGRSTTKILVLP